MERKVMKKIGKQLLAGLLILAMTAVCIPAQSIYAEEIGQIATWDETETEAESEISRDLTEDADGDVTDSDTITGDDEAGSDQVEDTENETEAAADRSEISDRAGEKYEQALTAEETETESETEASVDRSQMDESELADETEEIDAESVSSTDYSYLTNELLVMAAQYELYNGGDPGDGSRYWGWLGMSSYIWWCATFASFCVCEAGFPIPKYCSCTVSRDSYYKPMGQWIEGHIVPAPGMLIYFDWEQDGELNHTGVVIRTDDYWVYTIEGHKGGRQVDEYRYEFDDPVIVGYAWLDPATSSLYSTYVHKDDIQKFVKRLYSICLGRSADSSGLADWTRQLILGKTTGVKTAYGFIFSDEFKNKNLCDSCYVEFLYEAFLGRSSDSAGKATWVNALASGKTREEVFNGFAMSREFAKICAQYHITQGSAISVPSVGTTASGKCSYCGNSENVKNFVTRLYNVCLNRNPDAQGLANWCKKLQMGTSSGSAVALGFIFSTEFKGKNYSNSEFVDKLYQALFGRNADAAGKAGWVAKLNAGASRMSVFNGFIGSSEFTNLCNSYGIKKK